MARGCWLISLVLLCFILLLTRIGPVLDAGYATLWRGFSVTTLKFDGCIGTKDTLPEANSEFTPDLLWTLRGE